MKYIVRDIPKNGIGDEFDKEFDVLEDAIEEAKNQWDHLTYAEQKKRTVYVLESVNPDEDADNHFDGNPVWTSEQKYEVDLITYQETNKVISPIDTIVAPTGYTAEDYISDCKHNAADDWCEMLKTGDVKLVEID